MGIWIELHCDDQSPAVDACGRMACVSGSGNQPGAMTTLQAPRLHTELKTLLETATKRGWTIRKEKLICPICTNYWKEHPK